MLFRSVRIELADLPFGGRSNFNEVGQDSVPQYPHKVTERDGPLFFGFRQSCVSVFQIDGIAARIGLDQDVGLGTDVLPA